VRLEWCEEMSISPVKRLILETMWVLDKPAKPTEIAKDTGVNFPAVMMHLIGLSKMNYAKSPEKGLYAITEKGKKSLGFPEVDREKASEIMAYQPLERSFQFYADYGKALNVHAASLQDFCDKMMTIDVSAIEFHVSRGDFEAWFNGLGDVELARKTLFVREQKMTGEELRKKLFDVVKNRCEELTKIRKQTE
jgi:hypothetical protein